MIFDANGLVPAIVQDARTGEVLTVAYMNELALEKTIETGETHFWSRSRNELWHKGATSGNTQELVALTADCDQDAVLIQVLPRGPACHTGERTCFSRSETALARTPEPPQFTPPHGTPPMPLGSLLARIGEVVADRKRNLPPGSYTTYLFEQGLDKICKKVGEEATEVVVALKNGQAPEIAEETADLLYHLLVALCASGVTQEAVAAALAARFSRPTAPARRPSPEERTRFPQ